MKIRIKGNSIRYRLSKTDVDQFLKQGYVEDVVNFGEEKLIYSLERNNELELSATFMHNKITLVMPGHLALEWESPEKIGFNGIHNELSLLIEKDFQCLDNVLEDQADNYPNPLKCN